MSFTVAIVGCGIAGVCAARRLIDRGLKPSEIVILDPLDRFGGRLLPLTQPCNRTPNHPVDVGACWICPEQKEVWRICEDFGLTIVAQEDKGIRCHVNTHGGLFSWFKGLLSGLEWKEEEYLGSLNKLPLSDLFEYGKAGKKLDSLAKEVIIDPKAPWTAKDAEKWDSISVEEWIEKEIGNVGARCIVRAMVLAVFCAHTTEYSMLMFLAALADESWDMFCVGAQSHRVMEGVGSIGTLMGKRLQEEGVQIQLNSYVIGCEQKSDGVALKMKSAGIVKSMVAKEVIITVPAPHYKDIAFKPVIPQLPYSQDMYMGKVIKTVLAYKEKWWKCEAGMADPKLAGPITLMFDVSHPGEPMLATFFYGANAEMYTGDDKKEKRRQLAIRTAQELLSEDPTNPDPRSNDPLSVVEGDWPSVPFIAGAYAGVPKIGAITKHKMHRRTLGKPFGKLHFAGTETSEHWAGYIEGGVLTGYRAADEIASSMGLGERA